ncbi:hypothetical protein ABTK45_20070, partial [Acinetobacter baumannii]
MAPGNGLLISELRCAGLVDEPVPTHPRASPPATGRPGVESDHGVFKAVSVRGVDARQHLEAWHRDFSEGRSRRYP